MRGAVELRSEERWDLFYFTLCFLVACVPWGIGFVTIGRWLIEWLW